MRRVPSQGFGPLPPRKVYRVSCINWAGEVYKRTTTSMGAADKLWADINGMKHVLFAAFLVDGQVTRTYQRQALYVVMGNDFPCGIASGKPVGEGMIGQLRAKDQRHGVQLPVHYRLYGFTVDGRELET